MIREALEISEVVGGKPRMKMKTKFGDDTVVYYTDKQFWFNGQSLGDNIKDARAELMKITNNSNFRRTHMNGQEMKDKKTIEKSIDRHFKKIAKKDKSEFNFLDLLKEGN